MRASLVLLALSTAACVAKERPSDILEDPVVVAALQDLAARPSPSDQTYAAPDDCRLEAGVFLRADVLQGFDAPAPGPDITGTWTFGPCEAIDAGTYPTVTRCDGATISFSDESTGRITQTNTSVDSTGAGEVSYIEASSAGGMFILQKNHATGQGCEQDLVNAIEIEPWPQGGHTWSVIGIDVPLASTCPITQWKCFASSWDR